MTSETIPHDDLDVLLSKPYWVIDMLPAQVPAERGDQFCDLEPWLLAGAQGTELRHRFSRLVIELSCYYDMRDYRNDSDEPVCNPSPELVEHWVHENAGMLNIVIGRTESLISIPDDSTCMTLYNPEPELLDLVMKLAAANGLFVWQPPQKT